jgi:hypothetical protein
MSALSRPIDVVHLKPDVREAPRVHAAPPYGWVELFAAIQLVWGVVLFLPSVQPYRMYIRAVPYLASLGALAIVPRALRAPLPASSKWLLAAMVLLAANLLHADTVASSGIAQVVFQLSIAAPMFWVGRFAWSEARLARLVRIIFLASLASAAIGVLQVMWPDWFLPPEFSTLARRLNPDFLDALSYVGPDGRPIIRPPGLSDLPGGAAVAGLTTVLLGVAYLSHDRAGRLFQIFAAAAAGVGMTALYLTQVRSLTAMAAIGVIVLAATRLRQGRIVTSVWVTAVGGALVVASFMWAASIGGKSIETRFAGMLETGLLTTFQESRGSFLSYTLRELLFRFPFGAGLGRWGMMDVYFKDPAAWQTPPIHVEIQITGWLLDGGILMWVFYGGALYAACRLAYTSVVDRSIEPLQYLAAIVLSFQLAVIGLCLAGPVFNTQLGVLFWTVTGALFGTRRALLHADVAGRDD